MVKAETHEKMDNRWHLGKGTAIEDNLLEPITFEEVISTARCVYRDLDICAIRKAAEMILENRMCNYNFLLEANDWLMAKEARIQRNSMRQKALDKKG